MKRLYTIILFALIGGATFAQTNPVSGLTETSVSGLTASDYTFHFYTADGKLYKGFSEVFIALKDGEGNFVENFSASNFLPLMNMGMSQHSTPTGKVEKVEGKPLLKTWFAFLMYTGQMGGEWTLTFDYTIGSVSGKITNAAPVVEDVPAGQRWIQSFNSVYYASLAYPQAYFVGEQTLSAYINLRTDVLEPYRIVEGGYKIIVTPRMTEMNHGSYARPTDTLLWNAEKSVYEGLAAFDMEGDWRLYFKILDEDDNLIAGDEGTESSLYWNISVKENATGIVPSINDADVKVYSVGRGNITVNVSADPDISVINLNGQSLQKSRATANVPLNIKIGGKGLFLVNIKTGNGKIFLRKVIVR